MAFNGLFAGELTARIIVEAAVTHPDGTANSENKWKPIYGDHVTIPAKWRRKTSRMSETSDGIQNNHVGAIEAAVVHVRYNGKITASCRVKRIGDNGGIWYVVGSPERSPDGAWLEFHVERRVCP